jgi:hypothetical protein
MFLRWADPGWRAATTPEAAAVDAASLALPSIAGRDFDRVPAVLGRHPDEHHKQHRLDCFTGQKGHGLISSFPFRQLLPTAVNRT